MPSRRLRLHQSFLVNLSNFAGTSRFLHAAFEGACEISRYYRVVSTCTVRTDSSVSIRGVTGPLSRTQKRSSDHQNVVVPYQHGAAERRYQLSSMAEQDPQGDQAEEVNRPTRIESTHHLRFPCPERFDGSEGKFEDFAIHLRAYLTVANPIYFDFMHRIETQPDHPPIEFNNLPVEQKTLSAQLQQSLFALCKGPALKIVRQDRLGVNGFETLRRLYVRYRPIQKARAASRMGTLMRWTFDQHDFENSFNEWEHEINRYDEDAALPFA